MHAKPVSSEHLSQPKTPGKWRQLRLRRQRKALRGLAHLQGKPWSGSEVSSNDLQGEDLTPSSWCYWEWRVGPGWERWLTSVWGNRPPPSPHTTRWAWLPCSLFHNAQSQSDGPNSPRMKPLKLWANTYISWQVCSPQYFVTATANKSSTKSKSPTCGPCRHPQSHCRTFLLDKVRQWPSPRRTMLSFLHILVW